MKKILIMLVAGIFFFGFFHVANAVIVDIDATVNGSPGWGYTPVSLFFEAGTYDVTPISDTYTAWNAWGYVNVPGGAGWLNRYRVYSTEFGSITVGDSYVYETAIEAFQNASSTSFTLSSAGWVDFYVGDSECIDNLGGISLDVTLRAVTQSDWANTWHQVNFKVKGVCGDTETDRLFKLAASAPGYIYIIDESSAVVAVKINGVWFAGHTGLEERLGDALDRVFGTENPFTITNGVETQTMSFVFRLTGKEKNGLLASGKIASVSGYSEFSLIDDDGDCAAGLTVKGKWVAEEKVPEEAINAVAPFLPPQ